MKTIWKFPFRLNDETTVMVPFYARPIWAGLDPDGTPCVWCEVQSSNTDREEMTLFVVGTGKALPHEAKIHLGSFVHGPFVWHIFTQ